jgi:hypothetical protein
VQDGTIDPVLLQSRIEIFGAETVDYVLHAITPDASIEKVRKLDLPQLCMFSGGLESLEHRVAQEKASDTAGRRLHEERCMRIIVRGI